MKQDINDVVCTRQYNTPCGPLIIGSLGDKLCLCDWVYCRHRISVDRRIALALRTVYREVETETNTEAVKQLDEYFLGKRKQFTIPLLFIGTDFQKSVWRMLLEIPYGKTLSYGYIAEHLGKPNAVRAVANACYANAIAIFAPCHRVIASDGMPSGYSGGADTKKYLLEYLEAKHMND